MDINSAVGRKSGLRDEQFLELGAYESSAAFTARERLVLRLADAMTAVPTHIPAELFAALRAEFTNEQLVELASALAWENYRARFNRVFDVGSQGFSAGGVCVLHHARHPHA